MIQKLKKKKFYKLTNVLTVCVIALENGFTVTGESDCVSPENYDKEIGENIAFANARDKIWQLEGYLLKQKLYEESLWLTVKSIIKNYAECLKKK